MADKIIAPIAMLLFLIYVAFLAYFVNETALWVVIGIVAAMATYDFWETIRHPENGSRN